MEERMRSYEGESSPERGSSGSGSGQLPSLTIREIDELRHIDRYGSVSYDQEAARSIAAKLSDPKAFKVHGDDVLVDWGYVLGNVNRLFSS